MVLVCNNYNVCAKLQTCNKYACAMRMRRIHCASQSYCERINTRSSLSEPWISGSQREKKKMADRDNNVYLAKLAEQAERYDGKWITF